MEWLAGQYPIRILFVCSRNRRRSLTAELIFRDLAGIQVRSCGTQPQARIVVSEGLLRWAELIFVMEKSHLNRLSQKYSEVLEDRCVITLHIPDNYEFMQPELIDELRSGVGAHLGHS